MAYVEFLRARRSLLIFALLVALASAVTTISLKNARVGMHGAAAGRASADVTIGNVSPGADASQRVDFAHSKSRIPLVFILLGAGFVTLIYATVVTGSLNCQRENLNLAWTKPIGKPQLALRFIATDVAAIVAAYGVMVAAAFVPIAAVGMLSHVDASPAAWAALALGLGAPVMWYGMVQAATAWNRVSAGSIVGLSWGLFLGLLILNEAFSGTWVSAIVGPLNFLNPLAYISLHADSAGKMGPSMLGLSLDLRALATWTIGLAACAVATFTWDRAEA